MAGGGDWAQHWCAAPSLAEMRAPEILPSGRVLEIVRVAGTYPLQE